MKQQVVKDKKLGLNQNISLPSERLDKISWKRISALPRSHGTLSSLQSWNSPTFQSLPVKHHNQHHTASFYDKNRIRKIISNMSKLYEGVNHPCIMEHSCNANLRSLLQFLYTSHLSTDDQWTLNCFGRVQFITYLLGHGFNGHNRCNTSVLPHQPNAWTYRENSI